MQGNEAHIIRQINHVEFENEHEDGDWPIVSKPLELEGVGNVRDMGGIPTQDGRRIRPGMLLRSADLHKATDADLATLDRLGVRNIIDLRTRQERHMEEDRLLPDWRYFPIPVFDEGGELGKQLRGLIAEPGMFIESLYPQMIDAPMAVSCWKDCFGHLLDDGGGTLWHCTQGKDRTGALAALVLASLGVDETLIIDDYLETNRFMPHTSSKLAQKLESILGARVDGDINQFLTAAPAYIHAFIGATTRYGGLVGFLRTKVGLSETDFERLRERYTCDASDMPRD